MFVVFVDQRFRIQAENHRSDQYLRLQGPLRGPRWRATQDRGNYRRQRAYAKWHDATYLAASQRSAPASYVRKPMILSLYFSVQVEPSEERKMEQERINQQRAEMIER